jgi:Zn-dependent M28 family amino/carboxypeptidase
MRFRRHAAMAVVAVAAMMFAAGAAAAPKESSSKKLRERTTLGAIAERMDKLQAIADAHQDNRAAATIGYEQSATYVERVLEHAGYDVFRSPFDFPTWEENSPPELEQISPTPTVYTPGGPADDDTPGPDFITFEFSGAGEVEAPVVPTNDIVIPPVGASDGDTSGCEPSDFPPETSGAISLIQRGTCPFVQKLANAVDAGAVGVILFNEGNPGRTNALFRSAEPHYPIPAVLSSFAVGEDFYDAYQANDDPVARIAVDATTIPRVQENVIADSPWGNPNRTVLVGGHLDSVPEGPGINDNGSGTMSILEIAVQMSELHERAVARLDRAKERKRDAKASGDEERIDKAKDKQRRARNKMSAFRRQSVRFAFWGAEEFGLIGSTQYVAELTGAEREQILLNLNFDMLASPNFARYVYDGNTDSTPPPPDGAPAGSDVIEQEFLDYFARQGLPTQPTPFDGRSDYGPFIEQGIPAGGLFSGAEDPKTAEQVSLFGGVEGEQLDPCYHADCDTITSVFGFPPGLPDLDTNGATSLDQMSDAVAHSTWHFVTTKRPLDEATTAPRPQRLRPYDLPFRGPLETG